MWIAQISDPIFESAGRPQEQIVLCVDASARIESLSQSAIGAPQELHRPTVVTVVAFEKRDQLPRSVNDEAWHEGSRPEWMLFIAATTEGHDLTLV
jgi:hypothetical protein